MQLAARWLKEWGWHTEFEDLTLYSWQASRFDAIVSSRPNQAICSMLLNWSKGRTRIVVDMDDDFTCIPPHNPAYTMIGPGNQTGYLGVLRETILLATGFTTSTAEVASRYKRPSKVMLNPWDEKNPVITSMRRVPHPYINIGWTGTTTHREDFKLVEPALKRILAERDNVGIVIGLDHDLYTHFSDLPADRRTYIQPLSYLDYPLTFSQFDIAISPLEDTKFTRAKSDIKLLDAACCGVPWVASPVLPYLQEAKGGMFAATVDEWYSCLSYLIDDTAERAAMGRVGKAWAWERRSEVYAMQWAEYLESLL
jgi:glycosyltransferase involved in cell wall biosynthesis